MNPRWLCFDDDLPPNLLLSQPVRRAVLFLDDDPARADAFLLENPHAVWVQTVGECLERLAENWDEVHLDHDLGGEHFVDTSREDCGMEVVRWLTLQPRPHLKAARFFVHSHNANAATLMGWQLLAAGFTAQVRPFGMAQLPPAEHADGEDDWSPGTLPRRTFFDFFRALFQNAGAARTDHIKRGIDENTMSEPD